METQGLWLHHDQPCKQWRNRALQANGRDEPLTAYARHSHHPCGDLVFSLPQPSVLAGAAAWSIKVKKS